MKTSQTLIHNGAHQTVSLEISTATGPQFIRIGFTDQRLTRFGGMAFWSAFLHKKRFRHKLQPLLPQAPTSPNAYEPTDVALGFLGGILCGADKFSRVAYLADDPAVAEVLGIEAVASQSTFSRFFAEFTQASNEGFARLHGWAGGRLASRREGYTLDLDSWALVHEDGQQEGVVVGYTRKGLKPCHRPLIAALAEPKLIAGFWLRRGDAACANNAVPFVENVLAHLSAHIRIGLVRGDAGFCHKKLLQALEQRGMHYIVVARLERKLQSLCRHDDTAWTATEVPGLTIQEVETDQLRQRLIILRHRVAERPQAGGKELLAVPGYRSQALLTNLPRSADAVAVWRRYNGRADSENRIKEVGAQFGVRGLCCQSFWATEAACLTGGGSLQSVGKTPLDTHPRAREPLQLNECRHDGAVVGLRNAGVAPDQRCNRHRFGRRKGEIVEHAAIRDLAHFPRVSSQGARRLELLRRIRLTEHVWLLCWASFPSLCGMWFVSRIRTVHVYGADPGEIAREWKAKTRNRTLASGGEDAQRSN